MIAGGMPAIEQATARYDLDEYYDKALSLVISGRARDAFDLEQGDARDARAIRQQHVRPEPALGPPAGRGGHARGRSELAQGRQLATIIRSTFTSGCRAA